MSLWPPCTLNQLIQPLVDRPHSCTEVPFNSLFGFLFLKEENPVKITQQMRPPESSGYNIHIISSAPPDWPLRKAVSSTSPVGQQGFKGVRRPVPDHVTQIDVTGNPHYRFLLRLCIFVFPASTDWDESVKTRPPVLEKESQ